MLHVLNLKLGHVFSEINDTLSQPVSAESLFS